MKYWKVGFDRPIGTVCHSLISPSFFIIKAIFPFSNSLSCFRWLDRSVEVSLGEALVRAVSAGEALVAEALVGGIDRGIDQRGERYLYRLLICESMGGK